MGKDNFYELVDDFYASIFDKSGLCKSASAYRNQ